MILVKDQVQDLNWMIPVSYVGVRDFDAYLFLSRRWLKSHHTLGTNISLPKHCPKQRYFVLPCRTIFFTPTFRELNAIQIIVKKWLSGHLTIHMKIRQIQHKSFPFRFCSQDSVYIWQHSKILHFIFPFSRVLIAYVCLSSFNEKQYLSLLRIFPRICKVTSFHCTKTLLFLNASVNFSVVLLPLIL